MKNLSDNLHSVAPKGVVSPVPEKLQAPGVEDFLSELEGLDHAATRNGPFGMRNAAVAPRIEAPGPAGDGAEPAAGYDALANLAIPPQGFDAEAGKAAQAALRIDPAAKASPEPGRDTPAPPLSKATRQPQTDEGETRAAPTPPIPTIEGIEPNISQASASADVTPLAAVFDRSASAPLQDRPKVASGQTAPRPGEGAAPSEPETWRDDTAASADAHQTPALAWGQVQAVPSAAPTPDPPAPGTSSPDAWAIRTANSAGEAVESEGSLPVRSGALHRSGADLPISSALRPPVPDPAANPATTPRPGDNDAGQVRPATEAAATQAPTKAVSSEPATAQPPETTGIAPVKAASTPHAGATSTQQIKAEGSASATIALTQTVAGMAAAARQPPSLPTPPPAQLATPGTAQQTTPLPTRPATPQTGSELAAQFSADSHQAQPQRSAHGLPGPGSASFVALETAVAAAPRSLDSAVPDEAGLGAAPQVSTAGSAHSAAQPATSDSGPAARPVAVQLAAATARHNADGTIEVNLSPQELGRVRMVIHHDGAVMNVAIHADRSDTLDLMRRHAEVLAQEFRAQGYSGTAFAFSGGDGSASGGQDRPPVPDAPPPSPSSVAATQAPQTMAAHRARGVAEGLDLRL